MQPHHRPGRLALAIGCAICLAATSCSAPASTTAPSQTVTSLTIAGPATLDVTQTAMFTAMTTRSSGVHALETDAVWSTDAPTVLAITPAGQATALTAGHAMVSVDAAGRRATLSVTVQNPLIGEWLLSASNSPGTPSGIGTRHKTFTADRWEILQRDASGQTVFHHGGTYSLANTSYVEHLDFAEASADHLIGQTGTFVVQFGAGTYQQTSTIPIRGAGGPLVEVWAKLP
jgi:hypothetical protein